MPPTELAEAVIGSLIIALGLVAVAFASAREPAANRPALWFGLFACLYGVRLAGDSALIWPLVPVPPVFWYALGSFITYAILTPGALFVESLLGPGWRGSLRRTRQALAAYAALAIAHDLARGEPGALLWLNPFAVVAGGSVATGHLLARWRRARWPPEVRVAVAGGLVFAAVALYETLGGSLLGGDWDLEPMAMLIFIGSLGYFVARRALAGEQRLTAVSRELALAREIQQSILPRGMPALDGLRVAGRYLPMREVAGDFYDFVVDAAARRLGVIVADVSGHGMPAALVASMVKVAFAAASERLDDPGRMLEVVNRTLWGKFDRAYVTACCGVFDAAARRVRYAGAGHPPPLLQRADGRAERLEERGLALTFDPHERYATAEIALAPGDRVVFFTDGLVEAEDAAGAFFGDARFGQIVAAGAALSADRLADRLLDEMRRWTGARARLQDDVTVVVVDVAGGRRETTQAGDPAG